jgi:hypothetical protein
MAAADGFSAARLAPKEPFRRPSSMRVLPHRQKRSFGAVDGILAGAADFGDAFRARHDLRFSCIRRRCPIADRYRRQEVWARSETLVASAHGKESNIAGLHRRDQNLETRKTPPIIKAQPARRAGLAECCTNPIQPKWSSRTENMSWPATTRPTSSPAPSLGASRIVPVK